MKILLLFIIIILNTNVIYSRSIGETEITAEDGIEVFQDEKYYLLKKNVKIESDNFILFGDIVKISFENDLYDIQIINADGNVDLVSAIYKIKANGDRLKFTVKNEEIQVEGEGSKLITHDTKMFSDGIITVNNINGKFNLSGFNSSLETSDITIKGEQIKGMFTTKSDNKEILILDVYDENIAYINNNEAEMFANNIKYKKETSIIELENNVKIISEGETITGDYGTLDTQSNSYKIKSNDKKKVRVIISNSDE
tara:strand:+ start:102 stop:866 length:765 start_codon:yes stop_codon:yes gene_type:complete